MAKKDHWDIFDVAPSAREAGRAPVQAATASTEAAAESVRRQLAALTMPRPVAAAVLSASFGLSAALSAGLVAVLVIGLVLGGGPFSPAVVLISTAVLAIIVRFNWIAMKGLWRGEANGWAMGLFVVATVFINAIFLMIRAQMGTAPGQASGGAGFIPAPKTTQYAIRSVLFGALLLLMALPSVRMYCGVARPGVMRAVARAMGPWFALTVVVQVLLILL